MGVSNMKNRIYIAILLFTIGGMLLTSATQAFIFYREYTNRIHKEIMERFNRYKVVPPDMAMFAAKSIPPETLRISIIDIEGKVVFDNTIGYTKLDNHSDRPEYTQALAEGSASITRHSPNSLRDTWYYAVKTQDNFVIRAAVSSENIFSFFLPAIPIILTIVVLDCIVAYFVAKSIAAAIPASTSAPVKDPAL